METVYSIYKAVNLINGKIYIGFDSNWPNRQFSHLKAAEKTPITIFHRAIAKHGANNFQWEVISQSREGDYTLNVLEPQFIREYNSHYIDGHGYNMTYGGTGALGYKKTEEHKNKIRIANTGKEHWWQDKINKNPEKIARMAEKHRGMKRTEEAKEKMSIIKRGKPTPNTGQMAIHNPLTKQIRYIPKNAEIPEGFIKGGIYNRPKKKHETINNNLP